MFVFSVCKQQPRRSYHYSFCSIVWIPILHSYVFIVCVCMSGIVVFFCMLLHIESLFVFVSLCRTFVLCCVYVEQLLFVVVFLWLVWCVKFQFANNKHAARIINLSAILFEFHFARLLVRTFWLFVIWVLFFVFVFLCMLLLIRYVFVVCRFQCCRLFVLCCVSVEQLLFVLVLRSC